MPSLSVPAIALLIPGAVFALYIVLGKPSRLEGHNLILGLFCSVLVNAVVTNIIKINVRDANQQRWSFLYSLRVRLPNNVSWKRWKLIGIDLQPLSQFQSKGILMITKTSILSNLIFQNLLSGIQVSNCLQEPLPTGIALHCIAK